MNPEILKPVNEYLNRVPDATKAILSDAGYQEKERITFPYSYEINAGAKKVFGYGVKHIRVATHPMFADLKKHFEESDPDVVFIEGFEILPSDRDKLREYFAGMTDEQAIQEMGESGYVLKLAAERGLEVISPEPGRMKELEVLEAEGKNRDDIFAYYFYRAVNQYKGTDFESYIQKRINRFKENAKWDNFDFSIEHAKEIGTKLWGTPLNLEQPGYYNERVSPLSADLVGEVYGPVNEVAARVTLLRDEEILKQTAEVLASHDRLFIAYGGTHMVKLEPALQVLLGGK